MPKDVYAQITLIKSIEIQGATLRVLNGYITIRTLGGLTLVEIETINASCPTLLIPPTSIVAIELREPLAENPEPFVMSDFD